MSEDEAARGPSARKRPVHLTPDLWQAARALYETEDVGVEEIARRMDVTAATITRRVRRDGWVRAGRLRDLMDAGDTRGLARMVARLAQVFEHQIAAIETQLQAARGTEAGADTRAGTLERNARTLGSLAKTLDVLIELRAGVAELAPSGEDEDALRRELAQRLDRLCRQGKAAGLPVPPEPPGTDVPAS